MDFRPIYCALLLIGTGIVAAQGNSNSENNKPSFESPGIQMIAETTQAVNYRTRRVELVVSGKSIGTQQAEQ
jgi:hypothetical protein